MRQSKKDAVRLNKLISEAGFCSRREADLLIEQERVTVNSHTAKPGDRAFKTDFIKIDGEPLRFIEKPVYVKPKPEFASKRITRNLGKAKPQPEKQEEKKARKEPLSADKAPKKEKPQASKAKPAAKAAVKGEQPKSGAAKLWFSRRKK